MSRSVSWVLLLLALAWAVPARAQSADGGLDVPAYDPANPTILDPPHRALWHARDGAGSSVLVPMLETPAVDLSFWGTDRLAGAGFARISFTSIKNHLLHGPWEWDHDIYFLNEFGHPYHGTLVFTAARSSGLDFWESIPFVVASSAMWEVAFETDDPSKNDMITTPIGGVVFGEVLHRLSLLVLDEGQPTVLRSLAAFGIEPMGGVNRTLFGRRKPDFFHHPPYWARLSLGANFNVNNYRDVGGGHVVDNAGPMLHVGADVLYGLPGDPETRLREPFDHFALTAELELSRALYGAIFSRGLILGTDFANPHFRGLMGAFGGYDYASPGTLRVAAVTLGLGASAQVPMHGGAFLMPTAVLDMVPFGAGGGIATPVVSRDYHYGPGLSELLELQLVRPGVGRMAVTGRGYIISGQFVGEGSEYIEYLTFLAELMVFDRQAVGMEAFIADRRASYENLPEVDVHQRASQIRFYWTLVLGDAFNGHARSPGG